MSSVDNEAHDDLAFYHWDENSQLIWTDEGLRAYKRRFARFGIRINAIKTRAELRSALEITAAGLNAQLLDGLLDKPQTLERRALIAAIQGPEDEFQRLKNLLIKRNTLGLQLMTSKSQE